MLPEDESLPGPIQDALKTLDTHRQRCIALAEHCRVAEQLVAEYAQAWPGPTNSREDTCQVDIDKFAGKVVIVYSTIDLRRVIFFRRRLRQLNYSRSAESYIAPYGTVYFSYGHIGLEVHINTHSPNVKCRRVQVGTREEAVYEWRCNGDEPIDLSDNEPEPQTYTRRPTEKELAHEVPPGTPPNRQWEELINPP
jgi:hypothetical protein